ncbi:hypothetical protein [Hydrogenophaga sp.]|uniref:hypothetical protein n=1 Tax=Hydrogenophaga sp. TaxID=1904254 RepID=UPI00272BDE2D|nr:hypothetical protein [Hydrogenophaga sp.]
METETQPRRSAQSAPPTQDGEGVHADKANAVVPAVDPAFRTELRRRAEVLQSAEPVMRALLHAIAAQNGSAAAAGIEKFTQSLLPINNGSAIAGERAIDMYSDRMKMHVQKMNPIELKALEHGAGVLLHESELESLDNPVVAGINMAIQDELRQRKATPAFNAASARMDVVLKSLVSGTVHDVQESSQKFVAELTTLNNRLFRSQPFAGDLYNDRLSTQLRGVPFNDLEAVSLSAAKFLSTTNDPVVSRVDFAVTAERLRRMDSAMRDQGYEDALNDLSPIQLETLGSFVARLLEHPSNPAPNAAYSDVIPGTTFNRANLDDIRDRAGQQLAAKILQ